MLLVTAGQAELAVCVAPPNKTKQTKNINVTIGTWYLKSLDM